MQTFAEQQVVYLNISVDMYVFDALLLLLMFVVSFKKEHSHVSSFAFRQLHFNHC